LNNSKRIYKPTEVRVIENQILPGKDGGKGIWMPVIIAVIVILSIAAFFVYKRRRVVKKEKR